DPVAWNVTIFVLRDERLDTFHQPDVARNVDDPLHGTAEQQDLAIRSMCCMRDRPDTADIRGEGGDRHPALGAFDDLAQPFRYLFLGRRNTVTLGIGGIAHECQHALVTDLPE